MAITPLNTQGLLLSTLNNNSAKTDAIYKRLATGFKRPQDDVAALAIGSRIRAENAELAAASQNLQQAKSVTGIAEGALSNINDLLVRAKELSVQAGNGTLSDADRSLLNAELGSVFSEIDRIAGDTQFNGQPLLSSSQDVALAGSPAGVVDASVSGVGEDIGATNNFSFDSATNTFSVDIDGVTYSGQVDDSDIDASGSISGNTAVRLQSSVSGQDGSVVVELDSSFDTTVDSTSDLSVTGASSVTDFEFGAGDTAIDLSLAGTNTTTLGLNDENISTQAGADQAIAAIDAALDSVSFTRADVGAIENQIDSAIESIDVTRENLEAAQSSYLEVDVLSELSEKAAAETLLQANLSTLLQGNNINRNFVLDILSL